MGVFTRLSQHLMPSIIFLIIILTNQCFYLQAFPGHQGPVSCLTFRQGTSELFSGSFDRTVKIWNAEDRAYINTLFGHQGEVLNIDCLRKERVLTVGHDRSMHLFKVSHNFCLVVTAWKFVCAI